MHAPNFAKVGVGRSAVLVNPNANGNGTATTIQQGIDMVGPGGKVMVLPGTYGEVLVIDKALTLEGIGGQSGSVIIAPPSGTVIAVSIETSEPVTLRNLAVHATGANGIVGVGPVNLTVERAVVRAIDPTPPIAGNLIAVVNNAATGQRAALTVRRSFLDGSVTDRPPPPSPFPQIFGIRSAGDVDAVIEGNVIRRAGGACIFIVTRNDLAGESNADLLGNDLDECHPAGRVASIIVGPLAMIIPSPQLPLTATGVVNILGNTIRNTVNSCLTSSAIVYEAFTGRIEHNRIQSVVQECAPGSPRNLPSAIWIGAIRPVPSEFPPVTPTVRYNDITGNAFAGLRIGPNQTIAIDASCNYWGSADGPSGVGPGSGDAVVVEAGGATPVLLPFAAAPIAGSAVTGC